MEPIKIDKDKILERQSVCSYGIKYYERAYREARKDNDEFYMKSYLIKINRAQAEFNALQWVLTQCEIKE